MNELVYEKHYKEIKNLTDNVGIDGADDYLKQELSDISKNVIHIRGKISDIEKIIKYNTNNDEIMHLKYDIEDANDFLNDLLKDLKNADEKYLCFKEYLRRKKIQHPA